MVKTIRINKDQSIELNSSMGWLYSYREQFGHDILPDLMPMIESLLGLSVKVMQKTDGAKGVIDAIDDEVLTDFVISISGAETLTLLSIIWAMAKNANPAIAAPEEYFDQFETFPLDKVVPAAARMILDSSVSSKNAKRLLTILKGIQSRSTRSPSQESIEG